MTSKLFPAALAAAVACAPSAFAHHSGAQFDAARTVTVTGVIASRLAGGMSTTIPLGVTTCPPEAPTIIIVTIGAASAGASISAPSATAASCIVKAPPSSPQPARARAPTNNTSLRMTSTIANAADRAYAGIPAEAITSATGTSPLPSENAATSL